MDNKEKVLKAFWCAVNDISNTLEVFCKENLIIYNGSFVIAKASLFKDKNSTCNLHNIRSTSFKPYYYIIVKGRKFVFDTKVNNDDGNFLKIEKLVNKLCKEEQAKEEQERGRELESLIC